ncbi:MAG: aspartate aminotransferase family protein [Patescibacteria group bacterium]
MIETVRVDEFLRVYKEHEEHVNAGKAALLQDAAFGIEKSAKGSWVTNTDDIEFLDCMVLFGSVGLGYGHPELQQESKDIIDSGVPMGPRVMFNTYEGALAKRLAELTPGTLNASFFCNSGAEAVEAGLKLARAATGKTGIIATHESFHGKTFGALSVSGRGIYKENFEPLLPGVTLVPFGNIAAMEAAINETTAVVIIELIQGEGGINIAPKEYVQRLRQLCTERGVLLFVDEVQTGLGRTGALFACNHYDIEPDIMALAKILSGGIVPIGAMITTTKIFNAAYGENPLGHSCTYGGNALACGVGLKVLDILVRENLPEQARISGEYILEQLKGLQREFPHIIRECRGLGLLIGIELEKIEYGGFIMAEMRDRRVIVVYTMNQPKVIRIEPPLNISRADINFMLRALRASLQATSEMI